MLRPIVRGAAANAGLIFHVFAQDSASTTGAGKASVAYSSFTCYYIRSGEAISGAITPQDITTIGTYAAPTANTNIRIKAVDNTNMIGVYELQLHLDWVNTTNTCQSLTIYLSATGVAVLPLQIPLTAFNPQLLQAVAGDAMTLTAAYDSAKTAATQTSVNTIDDFLDTEIADIKAKTDLIPASPAAVGSAMTLTSAYDAAKTAATQTSVNTIDDYVDTEIAALQTDVTAIRAKTDAMATAGDITAAIDAAVVDVNIKMVNNTTVTGTGAPGTEWGP